MTSGFRRHIGDGVALYNSGQSLAQIAKRYYTSRQTVRKYLEAAGVTMRSRGGTNNPTGYAPRQRRIAEHADEVLAMYKSGKSASAIAQRFGFEATAVRRLLKRHGVTMRPRGGNNNPTGRRAR